MLHYHFSNLLWQRLGVASARRHFGQQQIAFLSSLPIPGINSNMVVVDQPAATDDNFSFSLPRQTTRNTQQVRCLGAGFSIHTTTTTTVPTRYFSSNTYHSPLDELLDPDAPCPVFGTRKDAPLKRLPEKFLECGLNEDLMRFRTVNYGKLIKEPFIHTNEHRVTLLVNIKDLPLDDLGKQILQQVIGISRYNVERGQVKMQCVYFASRIENKRYLVRMFDKLIMACQRLSKSLQAEKNGGEGGAPQQEQQGTMEAIEAAKDMLFDVAKDGLSKEEEKASPKASEH